MGFRAKFIVAARPPSPLQNMATLLNQFPLSFDGQLSRLFVGKYGAHHTLPHLCPDILLVD